VYKCNEPPIESQVCRSFYLNTAHFLTEIASRA